MAYFKVKVPYLSGETERKVINNFNRDSPSIAEIEILDLPIPIVVPTPKSRYSVGQTLSEEYKRQVPHYNRCHTFSFFWALCLCFLDFAKEVRRGKSEP